MANDRDKLKTHTPPAGVRAQTARPINESFDEETPVDGDPVSQINTRAKNAAASSRAAFGAIGALRTELRASVERDVEDHRSMTDSINRVDGKVDELGRVIGDMREDMGEVRGTLHVLVNQMEAERKERADSDKIKALTDAEIKKADAEIRKAEAVAGAEIKKATAVADAEIKKAETIAGIDETKDRAKHKRKIGLKVFGAILTLLGLLGTIASQAC